MDNPPKGLIWISSSKRDILGFPDEIRKKFGFALWQAQQGATPVDAKVLRGFRGASVLEVRGDHDGSTYRAVYTVRFADFVYVLHAFQKKSKKGSKTPPNIIELVKKRLKSAEEHYEEWESNQEEDSES